MTAGVVCESVLAIQRKENLEALRREVFLQNDPMPDLLGRDAVRRVKRYYDPKGKYSGRRFEFFGMGDDGDAAKTEFVANDIVAVSMLSVSIPGSAAIEILETKREVLNRLLEKIPQNVPLWEVTEREIDPKASAASELWKALENVQGVGWVTANKLLARKRPELLPVYDRIVKARLQPRSRTFWVPLRNSLRANDGALVTRLNEIRSLANLDVRPSLLRILDVAIWMTSDRV